MTNTGSGRMVIGQPRQLPRQRSFNRFQPSPPGSGLRMGQVGSHGLRADVAHVIGWTRTARLDPAILAAGCLMFALVLFLPQILNDGDTLWQIRAGSWILDHRAIPFTDPFSFTAGDRPWISHEWLAEAVMALAFRAGGFQGIMVLAAGAAGLTAAVLLFHLRRFLPGPYAVLALIVAVSNTAPSMLARPHLLAWPCLALWCGGLIRARADRTGPSLALLPVMLVWVNLHGSFLLGLLLPGAFMLEAWFDPGADRKQVLISWGRFIAAAWLMALLNPEFFGGLLFPMQLMGMTSLAAIGEWRPTDFSTFQPLEFIILGALALGLSGRVRLPPIRLLMLLVLVHGALAHARHEQLLGIVGVLVLAEPIGVSLGRDGGGRSRRGAVHVALGAALIGMMAFGLRIGLPLSPARTGAAFAATLDSVPRPLLTRPVLNEYGLGGHLIFNGVRPFIDSRADLYGDGFLSSYNKMASPNRTELERILSQYGIVWTIFPTNHPTVQLLDQETEWRRLVERDGLVIHARKDQPPQ
jgi:hypothetical protein